MNKVSQGYLTAGRLGAMVGLSADTIRFYEKRGVLPTPSRTPAGYRAYPPDAILRVRMIQGALAAGFTLAELAVVLKEREAGGIPCSRVVELAVAKLKGLDRRIAQLNRLRTSLATLVERWTQQLAETPPGTRAHLLSQLANPDISTTHTGKEIFNENQCLHIPSRSTSARFNTSPRAFAGRIPTE